MVQYKSKVSNFMYPHLCHSKLTHILELAQPLGIGQDGFWLKR